MKKTVEKFLDNRLKKNSAHQPISDNTKEPPRSDQGGFTNPQFKVGGNITGPGKPPKVTIKLPAFHWNYKTFDSNTEARDFINSEMINPKFMYPTGTGKLTIWWSKIVED